MEGDFEAMNKLERYMSGRNTLSPKALKFRVEAESGSLPPAGKYPSGRQMGCKLYFPWPQSQVFPNTERVSWKKNQSQVLELVCYCNNIHHSKTS